MKKKQIVIILALAGAVFASEAEQALEDGIYTFKVVAHKQEREKPYDDPPVDCALKTTGSSFSLTPTTNMEWTVSGTISNDTIRLEFHREHMDEWLKRGFRFEYEGTIVGQNRAVGRHRGFAGTNMYITGTWELTKKASNQAPEDTARKLADPQR